MTLRSWKSIKVRNINNNQFRTRAIKISIKGYNEAFIVFVGSAVIMHASKLLARGAVEVISFSKQFMTNFIDFFLELANECIVEARNNYEDIPNYFSDGSCVFLLFRLFLDAATNFS